MKISKLHIDQFRHLENLTFDFTYQSGERKGQPLDKICFIGQSATGKTSLLELIYDRIDSLDNLKKIRSNQIMTFGPHRKLDVELEFASNLHYYKYYKSGIYIDDENFEFYDGNFSGTYQNLIENTNEKVIHIASEILSKENIKLFEDDAIILIEKYKNTKSSIENLKRENIILNENIEESVWLTILEENINYVQNFLQFASELINSGSILDSNSQKKVDYWKSQNINPLIDFSNKFNTVLEKINLEVDLVNTKNIIPLKHKITNENIPISNISTGTKQLLLTAFPLFKLESKNSIILIDEPERSLYPDMQMDLMDYYKKLVPEAQFIVATHSPFIAASFEPDERFILYFDEDGKVAVRRGSSPIGDDPNDMLKNDFGVNYYNKHGEEAYQKYISLKQEVANETDPKRKKELLLETVKLGDTYNF